MPEPDPTKTNRVKYVPPQYADLAEIHLRAAGDVWTAVALFWNWAYDHIDDDNVGRDTLEKIFATASFTQKVRSVCEDLSFPVLRAAVIFARSGELSEAESDLSPTLSPLQRLSFQSNPCVTRAASEIGSQQRQQVVRRFYDHVDTFFDALLPQWRERSGDPAKKPEPPHKPGDSSRTDWQRTRIELEEDEDGADQLILKTARGMDSIKVEWPYPKPRSVQLVRDEGAARPKLIGSFDLEKQDLPTGFIRSRETKGSNLAGIDLGIACLAAAFDGAETILLDGDHLRQLRAVQQREKKGFARRLENKTPGSNRYEKISEAKRKRLKEIDDRIDDYFHKMSTRLTEELWDRGVSEVVYGDLEGIREKDYGTDHNRRLSRWAYGEFTRKLSYKLSRYGISIRPINEAYTTQTCPLCGTAKHSHKKGDRTFQCTFCDFSSHRDQVGAINIFSTARGEYGWHFPPRSSKADWATATGGTSPPPGSREPCQLGHLGRGTGRDTRQEGSFPNATHKADLKGTVDQVTTIAYDPHMSCVMDT